MFWWSPAYGGREHEPETDSLTQLEAGGHGCKSPNRACLLIPSFAIGRTQEIVGHWNHCSTRAGYKDQALPGLAMASRPRRSTGSTTDYYDAETAALLARGEGPGDFPTNSKRPGDGIPSRSRAQLPMS